MNEGFTTVSPRSLVSDFKAAPLAVAWQLLVRTVTLRAFPSVTCGVPEAARAGRAGTRENRRGCFKERK